MKKKYSLLILMAGLFSSPLFALPEGFENHSIDQPTKIEPVDQGGEDPGKHRPIDVFANDPTSHTITGGDGSGKGGVTRFCEQNF